MRAPAAPAGLGTNARRLWRDTNRKYDLETHELLILEQACRELDLIERMEAAIRKLRKLTVVGSMGQPKISDLVKDIVPHRAKFEGSIKALNLPADDAGVGPRSVQARAAANERWRRAG